MQLQAIPLTAELVSFVDVPNEQYPKAIADTWVEILTRWLPESKYEYDETRLDFEAYDERDHAWLHNNMVQMDICVPIREHKQGR